MTVRRFAKSRKLEVMTIELVALSALTLTPDSKIVSVAAPGRGAAPPGAPPAAAAPVTISLSVFANSTASACCSGRTWISPSPECGTSSRLMNSRMRRYARSVPMMTTELLRSSAMIFVTWMSLPAAAPFSPGLAAAGAAPPPPLRSKTSFEARRDVRRDAVVNRLDPDLVAHPADVDVLEDAHHALDVRAGVRDDEQVAGAVDGDVAVLRLEVTEHVRDLVGARVAQRDGSA